MGLGILYFILVAVMVIAAVGALIPGVPSTAIILLAILIWGFATGFQGMAISLVAAILVLLLSLAVEFLATYWGVKKFGASSWSQIGAAIGLVTGMFGLLPALPVGGPIFGLLFGGILGAFIGEFAYRQDMELAPRLQLSSKVCLGIVVGSLLGNVLKSLLAFVAVLVFTWTTWNTVPQVKFDNIKLPLPHIDWPVINPAKPAQALT